MKTPFLTLLFSCALQVLCMAQTYTIKNVSVLSFADTVGFVSGQTVVVKNGRISSITGYDANARLIGRIIDGAGHFLIPGMIDCYTHVHEKSLMLDLANGVTTVVNAIGEPYQLQLKLKVDAGQILAPRIYCVGSPIASSPPIYHSQGFFSSGEGAKLAVWETKRLGYDAVFAYVNVNAEVYKRVLTEAANARLPVFGHTPFRVDFDDRFQPGQLSHNNLVGLLDIRTGQTFPRHQLEAIAAKLNENKTFVIPTLTIHKVRSLAHKSDSLKVSPLLAYELPRQRAYWHLQSTNYSYAGAKEITKIFHEAGVKLLIGTDGGFHFVPHGFSYPIEMQNFSEAGISNPAILRAATIEAARYLNLDQETGSIDVGKSADLVLLKENPLIDIGNIRQIEGVMVRGLWLNRERLDSELLKLKNELNNLASARQQFFRTPKRFVPIASYTISINQVVAGEERIFKKSTSDGREVLLSINVIDPPLQRTTHAEWIFDNTTTQMNILRTGTEGETILHFNTKSDTCRITGNVPLFGNVNIKQKLERNTILTGPNTSVNIDMDMIASLQVLFMKIRIDVSESMQVPVLKAELNSEEWGNDAIIGNMMYTIRRLPDEQGMQVYTYSCPGFNGDSTFTLNGTAKVRNGILEAVVFGEGIVVKRTY